MKSFFAAALFVSLLGTASIGAAESKDQLLTDVRNHVQKLSSLISDKRFQQIQAEARTLRSDLQALLKKADDLSDKNQAKARDNGKQAIELSQAIEQNAEKSNHDQAQLNYRKLQTTVAALESAYSGDKGSVAKSGGSTTADQLLNDIDNHNKKLGKLISDRKFDQAHSEAEMLQNDVKALSKRSDLKSDKREGNLKDHEQKVIDLTMEIEKQVQRGDQSAAKAAYDRLQPSVKSIMAMRPNILRNQDAK